jgi:hypothetical protein
LIRLFAGPEETIFAQQTWCSLLLPPIVKTLLHEREKISEKILHRLSFLSHFSQTGKKIRFFWTDPEKGAIIF